MCSDSLGFCGCPFRFFFWSFRIFTSPFQVLFWVLLLFRCLQVLCLVFFNVFLNYFRFVCLVVVQVMFVRPVSVIFRFFYVFQFRLVGSFSRLCQVLLFVLLCVCYVLPASFFGSSSLRLASFQVVLVLVCLSLFLYVFFCSSRCFFQVLLGLVFRFFPVLVLVRLGSCSQVIVGSFFMFFYVLPLQYSCLFFFQALTWFFQVRFVGSVMAFQFFQGFCCFNFFCQVLLVLLQVLFGSFLGSVRFVFISIHVFPCYLMLFAQVLLRINFRSFSFVFAILGAFEVSPRFLVRQL